MHLKKLLVYFLVPAFISCKTDYENLPAFSEAKQLQAVIEIPAGSAHQIQYDLATQTFPVVQEAGRDRVIQFLPYPVNFGFIPSTLMPKKQGGNGGLLDVLVLGESQPTGTVMEVLPLGVLLLDVSGELEYKVLATPAHVGERLLEATTFAEFTEKYPQVKQILEAWFLNYDPNANVRFMGWKDEKFADEQIRKWLK